MTHVSKHVNRKEQSCTTKLRAARRTVPKPPRGPKLFRQVKMCLKVRGLGDHTQGHALARPPQPQSTNYIGALVLKYVHYISFSLEHLFWHSSSLFPDRERREAAPSGEPEIDLRQVWQRNGRRYLDVLDEGGQGTSASIPCAYARLRQKHVPPSAGLPTGLRLLLQPYFHRLLRVSCPFTRSLVPQPPTRVVINWSPENTMPLSVKCKVSRSHMRITLRAHKYLGGLECCICLSEAEMKRGEKGRVGGRIPPFLLSQMCLVWAWSQIILALLLRPMTPGRIYVPL